MRKIMHSPQDNHHTKFQSNPRAHLYAHRAIGCQRTILSFRMLLWRWKTEESYGMQLIIISIIIIRSFAVISFSLHFRYFFFLLFFVARFTICYIALSFVPLILLTDFSTSLTRQSTFCDQLCINVKNSIFDANERRNGAVNIQFSFVYENSADSVDLWKIWTFYAVVLFGAVIFLI